MLHHSSESKFRRLSAPIPSSRHLAATFWLQVALVVFVLPLGTHSIITSQEKQALLQIYNAYPALAFPPEIAGAGLSDPAPGNAWNSTFDNLCSTDGYEYFGIHCFNGHVDGIEITDSWYTPIGYNFSLISGLEYLTNVSVYFDYGSRESLNLTIAIARSTRVIHYNMRYHDFSASYFSFPEIIETLAFRPTDLHSLVNFTSMRSLDFYAGSIELPTEIVPGFASLRSLQVRTNLTWFADNVHEFESLESLTVGGSAAHAQSIGSIKFEFDSIPLQSFSLDLLGSIYPVFQVVINSSTLTSFDGSLLKGARLELATPNLRDLVLGGFGDLPNIDQFDQLESLKLSSFSIAPSIFPNLNFSSNMKVLELSLWSTDAANFERIICSLAQTSRDTFESFSASVLGVSYGIYIQQLPSCFSQFTNMKSFAWSGMTYGPPSSSLNGTTVWSYLPRTLTELVLSGAIADITPVPLEVLATFPLLEKIYFSVFKTNDILRDDFFESLPNLSDFNLITNVNGTIPSKNWQNLKRVLIYCNCESWNSIDFAPNLESLKVQSNFLTSMPSDAVFGGAGLTSLKDFSINSKGNLGGPMPTFWSQLPRIRTVELSQNGFQGTLPTLGPFASPNLGIINLRSNALCGTLPEVPEPITLRSLLINVNSFSGTVPNSWAQNLAIQKELSMGDNPAITGPIPVGLLDRKRSQCPVVSFYNTGVTQFGDLTCNPYSDVYFSNLPVDLCQNSPVPGERITCSFKNVSVCPATGNCTDRWSVCGSLTCTERTFDPISVPSCIEPPPRPTPPSFNCPLPAPTFGFICNNGQWIAPGNIHQPSISLPPNYGLVTINGSLYSGGVMTFNGIGTQIEVVGCVQVAPSQIVIELDEKETSSRTVTLLKQNGKNCPTDLSSVPLKVNSKNNGCKKTKVSTSTSTRSALVAVFTLDSSQCSVKWIVLGCVLGSVAIIAVVTVILLDKHNPKFHSLITTGKYK